MPPIFLTTRNSQESRSTGLCLVPKKALWMFWAPRLVTAGACFRGYIGPWVVSSSFDPHSPKDRDSGVGWEVCDRRVHTEPEEGTKEGALGSTFLQGGTGEGASKFQSLGSSRTSSSSVWLDPPGTHPSPIPPSKRFGRSPREWPNLRRYIPKAILDGDIYLAPDGLYTWYIPVILGAPTPSHIFTLISAPGAAPIRSPCVARGKASALHRWGFGSPLLGVYLDGWISWFEPRRGRPFSGFWSVSVRLHVSERIWAKSGFGQLLAPKQRGGSKRSAGTWWGKE